MSWTPHHSSETVNMSLQDNVQAVADAVRQACHQAQRETSSVTTIAVTKYVDLATTQELINAGCRHLGENRVDKFLDKYRQLQNQELVWHFIGSLQRRKVKDVINYIDYFHALDSLSLAAEIQKRATKPIKCFLQVNVSGEASKHGFAPEDVSAVVDQLVQYDKLEIVGLMTMAPFEATEAELASIFEQTRLLGQRLQEKALKKMPFTELSMGMSGDYQIAIQQGATFIRVGSAFFD